MQSKSIIDAIDTQLSNLGRIWVAEYLHAGGFNNRLNRDLFEELSSPKPLSTGRWVAFARRVRQAFKDRSMGRKTVVEGLADLDLGKLGDHGHRVSRLIDFRNTIDHGGLNVTKEDISTYQALLDEVLAQVPALRARPILFRTEDGRVVRAEDSGDPGPTAAGSVAVPPEHPFILGRDGKTVLDLYPLYYMEPEGNSYRLRAAESKHSTHPVSTLFEGEVLRDWVERYRWEKKGHLDFGERIGKRVTRSVSQSVLGGIAKALDDNAVLVMVEAHPGCGKAGVLKHLRDAAPPDRHAAVCLWLVEPDDLGQSGITLLHFLLREVEVCLGLADESLGLAGARWRTALEKGKKALEKGGKRLLLGIEDLHAGCTPLGNESVSVADVYRSLANGPITVLATVHSGRAPARLPSDRLVQIPVPAEGGIDPVRLDRAVQELCPPDRPMRRRVLRELIRSAQPVTLSALCEALEVGGDTVFEPAVERALWDLRPLLRVAGSGDAKTWEMFTPALARIPLLGGEQ